MRTNASSFLLAVMLFEIVLDFLGIIEVDILADNEQCASNN